MARRLTAALLLGSVVLAPITARAQGDVGPESSLIRPLDEPSEAEKERMAKEFMHVGVAEFRKNNFEKAREAFEKVWRLKPQPAVAATLAEVEMKLGRYREASEHWEYYIRELPPDRAEAEARLADCRQKLGSIRVSVDTPGAVVFVDGKSIGPAPVAVDLWVDPGDHKLYAQLDDRTSPEKQFAVAAGETHTITLTLPKGSASAPVSSGLSTSPVKPKPVQRDEGGVESKTIALIAGSVLTATAVGIGVGFTFKANAAEDDADAARTEAAANADPDQIANDSYCSKGTPNRSPACDEITTKMEDAEAARDVALASFIAAGVLGVSTAATYFLWPKNSKEQSASSASLVVVPVFGRDRRGVNVRLSF